MKKKSTKRLAKKREYRLKKNFGITIDEYNQIFANQKYCCAICGRHQLAFKTRFAVDHNHKTNKVRGLLCTKCNFLLGRLENCDYLDRFFEYLKL